MQTILSLFSYKKMITSATPSPKAIGTPKKVIFLLIFSCKRVLFNSFFKIASIELFFDIIASSILERSCNRLIVNPWLSLIVPQT